MADYYEIHYRNCFMKDYVCFEATTDIQKTIKEIEHNGNKVIQACRTGFSQFRFKIKVHFPNLKMSTEK